MPEEIILVDQQDKEIGRGDKMPVHRQGRLHRSFSVFIFNSKGELLLQKRANSKYHSPGLWANTCCSHPKPGQETKKEAERRLKEEMGVDCPLKEIFSFIYKVKLADLTEHEVDHVFIGKSDGIPKPNPNEVGDWRWASPEEIKQDIKKHPQKYAYWFKKILKRVLKQAG